RGQQAELDHEQRNVHQGQEQQDLGRKQAGPAVRAGDPELAVAGQRLLLYQPYQRHHPEKHQQGPNPHRSRITEDTGLAVCEWPLPRGRLAPAVQTEQRQRHEYLPPEASQVLLEDVDSLFHLDLDSSRGQAEARLFLAMARKISRKLIGVQVTLRTSAKTDRTSASVRSWSNWLSINCTVAPEAAGCSQVAGSLAGMGPAEPRMTCISRKRLTRLLISSENLSCPCSR